MDTDDGDQSTTGMNPGDFDLIKCKICYLLDKIIR